MMWIFALMATRIDCQHILFTQFTSRSCNVPPSAIRVIEDFKTLDVSLPWTDMLYSIGALYSRGQCGYAFTPNCCYSTTNAKATGGIGSAFLVDIENVDDYTSYMPQASNANIYLKISEINSAVLGNVFEAYHLCDGRCIEGPIRCNPNGIVDLFTDSKCRIISESIALNNSVAKYSGELGSFKLQFISMENGSFTHRYKTWVNYDNWGFKASFLGLGLFLAAAVLSILLTLFLLCRNYKHLLTKPSFYTIGNFVQLVFWMVYLVLFITTMFVLDDNVFRASGSLTLIFFALSLYISGIISAKMFLKFAILPVLEGQKAAFIEYSVYFLLTLIHILSCWPQYLKFIHAYYLGDSAFDSAYEEWYRYYDIWIYIIFIFNGLISTLWVAIFHSARIARSKKHTIRGRYRMLLAFQLLLKKDAGFMYIFLGQLFLLLSYIVISYSLIHIELTMDFFANDAIYDGFYAIETLLLTCHYALVDACILRMKTESVKSHKFKRRLQKPT